jgi:hypothetical protein
MFYDIGPSNEGSHLATSRFLRVVKIGWSPSRIKKFYLVMQLTILGASHFVDLTFCQHASFSTWHFVSLEFNQPNIFFNLKFGDWPFC